MSPKILKIRHRLFHRLTPSEIGVAPEFEQVIEPHGASAGGLRYPVLRQKHMRAEVTHFENNDFTLFISIYEPNRPKLTRMQRTVPFGRIDIELRDMIRNL